MILLLFPVFRVTCNITCSSLVRLGNPSTSEWIRGVDNKWICGLDKFRPKRFILAFKKPCEKLCDIVTRRRKMYLIKLIRSISATSITWNWKLQLKIFLTMWLHRKWVNFVACLTLILLEMLSPSSKEVCLIYWMKWNQNFTNGKFRGQSNRIDGRRGPLWCPTQSNK